MKKTRSSLGTAGMLLAAIFLMFVFCCSAVAEHKDWIGGISDWNSDINWNPMGVPVKGDSVYIWDDSPEDQPVPVEVSYNNPGNPKLKYLEIDDPAARHPYPTLLQDALTLTSEKTVIGSTAGTSNYVQTGGTHQTLGDLSLGVGARSDGVFTLTDAVVSVGGFEKIGLAGYGEFDQMGSDTVLSDTPSLGCHQPVSPPHRNRHHHYHVIPPQPPAPPAVFPAHSVGKNLYVGVESMGDGYFNMANGQLTVNGSIRVALLGLGTFDQWNGTVTIGGNDSEPLKNVMPPVNPEDFFRHRRNKGKATKLRCNPGTVKGPALIVGIENEGYYNLHGGLLKVNNDEIIGVSTKNNDTDLDGYPDEWLGGRFNQSLGQHQINGNLFLGRDQGSLGEFSLLVEETEDAAPEGAGLVDVRGFGSLGHRGWGFFYQTGGKVKFRGTDPNLSTNNKLGSELRTARSKEAVLRNLNCGGEENLVGLTVGREGIGEYWLSDGELLVSRGEIIGVFPDSSGYFNQDSGNHYIGGVLTIARDPGSRGVYDLLGGMLAANGGIVNNDTFNFSGGLIKGNITNIGKFQVTDPAGKSVSGDFVNTSKEEGWVLVTNANITFSGNFRNEGKYESILSTNNFKNLTVKTNGYLKAGDGVGDVFTVSGKFLNESKRTDDWYTPWAEIKFTGPGTRYFKTGSDPVSSFDWSTMTIVEPTVLRLQGHLHVKSLNGIKADSSDRITNLFGYCGIKITYVNDDPSFVGKWLYTSPWGKKIGKFSDGQLDYSNTECH